MHIVIYFFFPFLVATFITRRKIKEVIEAHSQIISTMCCTLFHTLITAEMNVGRGFDGI